MIYRVNRVGFTVSSLEEAVAFYTKVLPFEVVDESEGWGESYEQLTGVFGVRLRTATLKLGEEHIQLSEYLTPPDGRSVPSDSRSNDLWFQHIAMVVSDIEAAYAHLRQHHIQHVSTAPQTLPDYLPAAAGIKAFYFRDADGHNLELIWFPDSKGDPRWQDKQKLFLGIDHTAIGISDTARSLRFYRDVLGLTVAGESENYGNEQAHLNMVFGAHLQITGLQAPQGLIGVEFLQYLAPSGGRRMPPDTRPHDLWYWEMEMLVNNAEAAYADLQKVNAELVSAGVVELPDGSKGFLVRDPDGHTIKIMETDNG